MKKNRGLAVAKCLMSLAFAAGIAAEIQTYRDTVVLAAEERELLIDNTEESSYESEIDFEELKEVNDQIVGWIRIENTCIDYPIVQDQDSNEKYLHCDFEGNESVYGTIFLDWDDEPDFSSQNNIIYGHHMRDGSMFKGITYFKDMEYWEEHSITLYLPDREIDLTPLACLVTDSDAIRRKTEFEDEEEFQEYIKEMTEGAAAIDMPEEKIERLYSFVTCSYEFEDARMFLYCYEAQQEEQQ